jgi:hypothetical protein
MNRQRSIFVGIVLLLLGLLSLWFWSSERAQPTETQTPIPSQSPTPTPSPPNSAQLGEPLTKEERERMDLERRRKVVAQVESILNTDITFYGKVVDQKGEPVPLARVGYSLLDKFDASGTNGYQSADDSGHFEISGVKGAVLGVNVEKEGYYQIHNVSNQRFAYGTGPDGYTKKPPTKENPAVFVLQKKGTAEPLINIENRSFSISKDGIPVQVDLATGEVSSAGQLKVKAWTGEPVPGGPRFYDWKCRVSVPGGGLVERTGPFDFEAPAEGYRESDEIVMYSNDPQWDKRFGKEYFIKLKNKTYARMKFSFTSAGDHFFRIESYLNPTSGSRNLEYDPEKRINH